MEVIDLDMGGFEAMLFSSSDGEDDAKKKDKFLLLMIPVVISLFSMSLPTAPVF